MGWTRWAVVVLGLAGAPALAETPAGAGAAGADAAGTGAAGADAAAPLKAVHVELVVEKPLRLERFGATRTEPGELGLTGAVTVALRNEGAATVVLRDLESHGLVFRRVDDGSLHVLVHPCACVKEAEHPRGSVLEVAPGETRRVDLAEFGCGGGMWDPPPPGAYDLEYRALPGPAPRAEGDPRALTAACRAAFTDARTWEGAARSAPVRVTLRAPKKRR